MKEKTRSVFTPPSIALDGRGVVVVGCPACRKKLYTVSQFIEHLARDVIPDSAIIVR